MGNKVRRNSVFYRILLFGILLCGVCLGCVGMTVRAEEQNFTIDARMLPSDGSVYDIQLEVENQGQDWEGTVRLMVTAGYYGVNSDCAYDTELSLPEGSTKQFVVRIPKDSMERTDGIVQITLLDKNGDSVVQKEFGRLLQAEANALTMGILSDEYSALTYLDMGGNEFYNNGRSYPIRLEELDQDKLVDSLDALEFLVIDSYNTGVLSDKALDSTRQWIDDGGVLIIGTGSGAEEVLAGFDDLEIQCAGVNEPGTETSGFSDYVDVSLLSMADLVDVNSQYAQGYDISAMIRSQGNGAVEILPYSLSEVSEAGAAGDYEQQINFVESILWQVNNYVNVSYGANQYSASYDSMYLFQRICGQLGNGGDRLQFGGLKVIVILYVIFVGPVLYLLLRLAKKRDLYWIAVPVSTLVGIFLVYWAGRGFEVVDTHVYSVTMEDLSGRGDARTYLRCYDAGHGEWDLRLAEKYEYAGPMEDSYYRSGDEDFYYHIRKEGDRIFFGMNPSMGFEDGYFLAGIAGETEQGGIYSDLRMNGQDSVSGTVTNETEHDFRYFAVSVGDDVFVYKNLPAGAEVKLEEAEVVYDNDGLYYEGVMGYCYNFLQDLPDRDNEMKQDVDILTALGMGLSYAGFTQDQNATVIVGIAQDWDKAVDDNCSEVSYGCLYAVQ